MSDLKIIRECAEANRNEGVKELIQTGINLSAALDDLGYIVQNYDGMRIDGAVSGIGKSLFDIFKEIEKDIEHLE